MRIAIRFEGGAGDHICALRFLPAIKELYPDAKFYGYSDTEGNSQPSNFINTFWPYVLENMKIVPAKKRKPFLIKSQFGIENFIGALENIPDDISEEMQYSYDKFYDLHIDGLKWLKYDFNWSKYFFTFPEPTVSIKKLDISNTICVNLYSDANPSNRMDQSYVINIIKKISKNYNIVIVATEHNAKFYDQCKNFASVVCPDLMGLAEIIKSSLLFLTLDSGPKFLGYCLNTPTINYSSQVREYPQLPIHQMIRWQPFAYSTIPVYNDIAHTLSLIKTYIAYKTNILPTVNTINIDQLMVNRQYTII
jgi:ADP-heptose:LPS heptosyltransferase